MYCIKCGCKLTENASFCHNCGSPTDKKTEVDPAPEITKEAHETFTGVSRIKLPFRFIVVYGMEWLGIIISLFTPICAYYREYRGNVKVSNYCTVFGGSWAYIDTNYDPVSTPEKGHHYAQFFGIVFLAIAILCLLLAIKKKRYILGHLITVCAYALYSFLTLITAKEYFTYLESTNIKFTGMYIFAAVLMVISFILIIIFSSNKKAINVN